MRWVAAATVSLKVLGLLPILPSRYQYWPRSPPPLTCAIAKITPLHSSVLCYDNLASSNSQHANVQSSSCHAGP